MFIQQGFSNEMNKFSINFFLHNLNWYGNNLNKNVVSFLNYAFKSIENWIIITYLGTSILEIGTKFFAACTAELNSSLSQDFHYSMYLLDQIRPNLKQLKVIFRKTS